MPFIRPAFFDKLCPCLLHVLTDQIHDKGLAAAPATHDPDGDRRLHVPQEKGLSQGLDFIFDAELVLALGLVIEYRL